MWPQCSLPWFSFSLALVLGLFLGKKLWRFRAFLFRKCNVVLHTEFELSTLCEDRFHHEDRLFATSYKDSADISSHGPLSKSLCEL